MAQTLEEQVQQIKKKIAQVQKEQVKAEHIYETAKAASDKVKDRLKAEFGITTAAEAKAKLAEFEDELQEALERARQDLAEAG